MFSAAASLAAARVAAAAAQESAVFPTDSETAATFSYRK